MSDEFGFVRRRRDPSKKSFLDKFEEKRANEKAERSFRANYVEKGSPQDMASLRDLERDLSDSDSRASEYFAAMSCWEEAHRDGAEGTESQVDLFNKMYARHMMMSCVAPLRNGINQETLSDALTTGTMCYLFNKDFRKEVHESVQKALYPVIDAAARKGGPDSRWAQWRDRILVNQNDGRLPLTPRSAAVMQLGLIKRSYADMRRPGADVEAEMQKFRERSEKLRGWAERDGVSGDVLNRNVRTMVGKIIEHDPSQAVYFQEFESESLKRAPGRNVVVGGRPEHRLENGEDRTYMTGGRKVNVWRGEFQFQDGSSYDGCFSPRIPSDVPTHVKAASPDMHEAFGRCNSVSDVRSMYDRDTGTVTESFDRDMRGRQFRRQAMMSDDALDDAGYDRAVAGWQGAWKSAAASWVKSHPGETLRTQPRSNRGYPAGYENGVGPGVDMQVEASDDMSFGK